MAEDEKLEQIAHPGPLQIGMRQKYYFVFKCVMLALFIATLSLLFAPGAPFSMENFLNRFFYWFTWPVQYLVSEITRMIYWPDVYFHLGEIAVGIGFSLFSILGLPSYILWPGRLTKFIALCASVLWGVITFIGMTITY